MKALKRNCKVPFLIGGYFCSESPGDFNGFYFTRALIPRGRDIAGLARALAYIYLVIAHGNAMRNGYAITEKRGTRRNGKDGIYIAIDLCDLRRCQTGMRVLLSRIII